MNVWLAVAGFALLAIAFYVFLKFSSGSITKGGDTLITKSMPEFEDPCSDIEGYACIDAERKDCYIIGQFKDGNTCKYKYGTWEKGDDEDDLAKKGNKYELPAGTYGCLVGQDKDNFKSSKLYTSIEACADGKECDHSFGCRT
ncbi:MAG: hypothetical protein V1659_00610 [Candidatus Woesearchaeota archaeon]